MEINYFYTPYLDIGICCICVSLIAAMRFTYLKKNYQCNLLVAGVACIFISTILSIFYNYLLNNIISYNELLIHLIHNLYYGSLIFLWMLFDVYIYSLTKDVKQERQIKKFKIQVFILFILYVIMELLSQVSKFGFYIDNNIAYERFIFNPFILFYIIYSIIGLMIIFKNKIKMAKKIYYNIVFLFVFCFSIMLIQSYLKTTIYNNLSFIIPIISIFILLHNNSYDANTGTLDSIVYGSYIKDLVERGDAFTIITINISEYCSDNNIKTLSFISNKICHFCDFKFSKSLLFNKKGYILNIITKNKDKKKVDLLINETMEYINDNFNDYCLNPKMTVLRYPDDLIDKNYKTVIDFNKYLSKIAPTGVVYYCETKDKVGFTKKYYILEKLKEICTNFDLDDEHVKVYCQPILDCKSNEFVNAEILMRLQIPELGIVMPNDFIQIAEENGYIHKLTLIILNKTCKMIKNLIYDNYKFDRLSINFSVHEINDNSFCDEVITIITNNQIPFEKLAFEVTESAFNSINKLNTIMTQLNKLGIVFYLDDFGTGYSNINRITDLPFSTIKFDKSLLSSSITKENTKFIVDGTAQIFNTLKFNVLFEGVETEQDEEMCINMGAKYLQGYKYSKPVPIEELKNFFRK